MKKLFLLISMVAMSLCTFAEDYTYVVTVQVNCEIEYRDSRGYVLGRQSTTAQSQTFTICASSEGEAIREAISQCSSMCESNRGQYQGKAMFAGEECSKYLIRSIGSTSSQKYGKC